MKSTYTVSPFLAVSRTELESFEELLRLTPASTYILAALLLKYVRLELDEDDELEELSLTAQDIEFISMEVKENSKQYVILTWQEFESNYPRLSYDNGLGSQKINPTLTIYTKDYIFYRREYDGAEWFEYVPTKQYILDNADAFNDKNIIRADTYYGINNHCWNEGYDYDL